MEGNRDFRIKLKTIDLYKGFAASLIVLPVGPKKESVGFGMSER